MSRSLEPGILGPKLQGGGPAGQERRSLQASWPSWSGKNSLASLPSPTPPVLGSKVLQGGGKLLQSHRWVRAGGAEREAPQPPPGSLQSPLSSCSPGGGLGQAGKGEAWGRQAGRSPGLTPAVGRASPSPGPTGLHQRSSAPPSGRLLWCSDGRTACSAETWAHPWWGRRPLEEGMAPAPHALRIPWTGGTCRLESQSHRRQD